MSKFDDELLAVRNDMDQAKLPPELLVRLNDFLEEVKRLENDIAARVHIEQILRYIDICVSLPWDRRSNDILDLNRAKSILDHNHYGLSSVKDRILEYLAVLKLNYDRWQNEADIGVNQSGGGEIASGSKLTHAILARRAPILCLVGLVGTGKTTLAVSIAEALGRKYVRIPFGGMSDALELRGQSRVRPDAEMGLIIKSLRFAGTKNPVILLDEIDRVAEHARGDIMGVLVELLDPEQNSAFTDHYLDYPFDLSNVLFIATANNTTHISTAVLDRLEPIQMPSYTDEEKITIARDYVLPAVMRESGLKPENLAIDAGLWPKIVRPLGYDSGIRSLERTILGICRKTARMIVEGKGNHFEINENNLKEFLES